MNADNTVTARSAANTKVDLGLNNVENTALSTWAGTSNITTVGTLGSLTVTGAITANGGITGAAAKNMTVASLMPSAGTLGTGVGVIMTAAATSASPPSKRPDGSNLVAGDVWISW